MDDARTPLALPVGSDLDAAMDLLNREPWPRYVPGRSTPLPASVSDSFRETIAMSYRASEWMLTPTILFSGTRDLFLSLAVLVHRRLRRAGFEADLHRAEGASHFSHFINPFAPQSQELFAEMSGFLDRHLAG